MPDTRIAEGPVEGWIIGVAKRKPACCKSWGAVAPFNQLTGGGPDVPFDPAILDNLDVDVDLFGYFDPSFNLGAIDTALEANLDMGIPQTWTVPWSCIET